MKKLLNIALGKNTGSENFSKNLVMALIRIATGIMILNHGWQKLFTKGLSGTEEMFKGMDIPAPKLSALFAIIAEFGGGILLILGLFTSVGALLNITNLLGAIIFYHYSALTAFEDSYGLINKDVGIELPIIYILLLIAILVFDRNVISLNKVIKSSIN